LTVPEAGGILRRPSRADTTELSPQVDDRIRVDRTSARRRNVMDLANVTVPIRLPTKEVR
jgi:hypothetical protein